jgi:hypothetical protein
VRVGKSLPTAAADTSDRQSAEHRTRGKLGARWGCRSAIRDSALNNKAGKLTQAKLVLDQRNEIEFQRRIIAVFEGLPEAVLDDCNRRNGAFQQRAFDVLDRNIERLKPFAPLRTACTEAGSLRVFTSDKYVCL